MKLRILLALASMLMAGAALGATRFATSPGSESAAIGVIGDEAAAATQNAYTALTSSSPTLTAAQMVNSIVNLSGQTAAQTVTTDTAANIVALLPNLQVGSSFDLVVQNANTTSGAITFAGGTGVTIVGTNTLPISKTQIFKCIVTNATAGSYAVSVYALLTAGV